VDNAIMVPINGDIDKLKDSILDAAKEMLLDINDDIYSGSEAEFISEIYHLALKATVGVSEATRSIQMHLVADISRKNAWQTHPLGYSSLREYLQDTGLNKTQVSNLTMVGELLVPFCDAARIPIDHLLEKEHRSKTRNAIPALRSAIKANNKEQVQEILHDVEKAKNRDAIRKKYRNQREKYGRGTTVALADGRVLLLAVLDDDEAAQTIVGRMVGGVLWELAAEAHLLPMSIRVNINDDRISDRINRTREEGSS